MTASEPLHTTYDFDTIIDRHGHDALAVDGLGAMPGFSPEPPDAGWDEIPMWVADMNFATCPTIPEAIIERAKHPLYGYFLPTDAYFQSIIDWQRDRNGVTGLAPEHIGYENGVLGGVLSVLNAVCSRGDEVLLHSPTYNGFTMSLENAGYRIVHSPLHRDASGVWRMDYADMDAKLKAHNIHAAVFCSPHNPTGRVWERGEIEQAMEVYRANDVTVISDEIWSDLILPSDGQAGSGARHIPTQSVSDDARLRTAAFYAPSKTFNLAGLVGSYHIIYNKALRDRVVAAGSKSHYNEMNVLSMHALVGAYRPEGRVWVDELCRVLARNVDWACSYIEQHFDGVSVARPQGTYMLYLDCTGWLAKRGGATAGTPAAGVSQAAGMPAVGASGTGVPQGALSVAACAGAGAGAESCAAAPVTMDDLIRRGWRVGVGWEDGRIFHWPNSIRLNLALPFARVQEAFHRMDRYVFNA